MILMVMILVMTMMIILIYIYSKIRNDPITSSKTLGSMAILRLFELISVAHTVVCHVAVIWQSNSPCTSKPRL